MTFVVTLPTQRRIRCMKHPCGTPHPPGVPLLRCRQLIVNVNIAFWESRVKEKLGKMESVARRVWIYFAAGFGPAGPAGRLSPERREDRGSGSAIASEYAVSNEIRVPPIHAYNCLSTICCSHARCGDIAWRAGRASPGDTATPVSFVPKAPFFLLTGGDGSRIGPRYWIVSILGVGGGSTPRGRRGRSSSRHCRGMSPIQLLRQAYFRREAGAADGLRRQRGSLCRCWMRRAGCRLHGGRLERWTRCSGSG
jgi:hypothetical protein